ncbi:unnamed protein product, partial [Aphanomyces euteiches]
RRTIQHDGHATAIPTGKVLAAQIQEFVRNRRAQRMRTTAVDVLQQLRHLRILDYNVDCATEYNARLRATQRYLSRRGYKRGNRKGSQSYHVSKAHRVARDLYVRQMHPYIGSDQRPPIVYSDESYIHHHYKCPNFDLYDPSDELDFQPKEKHKGRRYCFIAAILDAPSMDNRGLALDIFTGGNTKAKVPKDYHAMFNQDTMSTG